MKEEERESRWKRDWGWGWGFFGGGGKRGMEEEGGINFEVYIWMTDSCLKFDSRWVERVCIRY